MQTETKVTTGQDILRQLASGCFDYQLIRKNAEAIRNGLPPNRQLLVTAMPKSGSTWLIKTLAGVTNRPHNLCAFSSEVTEELYFPALARDSLLREAASKLHAPATGPNLELIYAFNITPIVQTRNIFDAVVSQSDHLSHAAQSATPESLTPRLRHFADLEPTGQYDFVIETWVPSALTFLESWQTAQREHDWLKIHWVDYDALNQDPITTVIAILDFLNLTATPDHVRQVLGHLNGEETRKNKAVPGRGAELLSADQIGRVIDRTRTYPWADFAQLGIPTPNGSE